jgi:hypothetical protein
VGEGRTCVGQEAPAQRRGVAQTEARIVALNAQRSEPVADSRPGGQRYNCHSERVRATLVHYLSALLPLLLDLRPSVFESDGAVEDGGAVSRVWVDAEVAQALELKARARSGLSKRRFQLAAGQGLE